MKWTRIFLICLTAVVTIFVRVQRVPAQYVRPTTGGTMREFTFNNPMSALAATMVMNKAREDALAKQLGANPNSNRSSANLPATQPQAQPVKPADESSLRFRPANGYVKTRELADQLGNDRAQREQYFKLMNAVLDEFGKKVAAAGLQNDVAIALAYFFGENIRIYRGLPELSDQQFVNLRNNFASAIAAGGGLGNATDRQKQEMYETLVAYTGLTQFIYEQAKQANIEDMAKGAQQLAGQNLQTVTKASPDTLNLTADGLSIAADNSSQTEINSPPTSGHVLEIRQLAVDFRENVVRSNQLYQGKRIIATGSVSMVQIFEGKPALIFTHGVLIPDVICYPADVNQFSRLRSSQQVTVEATVLGMDEIGAHLFLNKCVLR